MEIRKQGNILLVCGLFGLFALAFLPVRPERPAIPADMRLPLHLPKEIGGWTRVRNVRFSEEVVRILGTRDVRGAVYRNGRDETVYLVLVSATNNRAAFHPPEYCMEGSGYELRDRKTAFLAGLAVNELRFTRGADEDVLVWNWYACGGVPTRSFYRQQAALLVTQMRDGHARGGCITLYTHLNGGDAERGARVNADFARSLMPCLKAYL